MDYKSIDIIKMECLSFMVICLVVFFVIISKITTMNNFMSDTLYKKICVMNFRIVPIFDVTLIILFIVVIVSIIPIRRLTKIEPINTY